MKCILKNEVYYKNECIEKIFRSDNGTEFVNQQFSNLFKEKVILHQKLCFYTPTIKWSVGTKKSTLT
jgi:hypothetical protein